MHWTIPSLLYHTRRKNPLVYKGLRKCFLEVPYQISSWKDKKTKKRSLFRVKNKCDILRGIVSQCTCPHLQTELLLIMPLLLEGTLSLLDPLDVHNLLINKKLHPIYDYFNTCTLIYIELEFEKLKKLHPIYDYFTPTH